MSEIKHTETPWEVDSHGTEFTVFSKANSNAVSEWLKENPDAGLHFSGVAICRTAQKYNGSGAKFGPDVILAEDEARANAEFICLAVNSHDRLIAENEALRVYVKQIAEFDPDNWSSNDAWEWLANDLNAEAATLLANLDAARELITPQS